MPILRTGCHRGESWQWRPPSLREHREPRASEAQPPSSKARLRTMTTTTEKKPKTLRAWTEQWVATNEAIGPLEELRAEAAEHLVAAAKKAGKERAFFGLVRAERTGGKLYMDQAAVREELGVERFVEGDLMRRQKRGWTLKAMR